MYHYTENCWCYFRFRASGANDNESTFSPSAPPFSNKSRVHVFTVWQLGEKNYNGSAGDLNSPELLPSSLSLKTWT